ncbi:MAG: FAD/NAD(P)-binding oxidoreductase [Peptococcaceae bacterium]|jgi:sulfide:quinone oxidoreductase|nr:NAD(P)/FAD-dependent oxidoreductase [Peptococcaceae bacterium]MDH7525554.1 FAD/NAD(P)-binding oxidoreductase [Peptococcaceae bacterium]
MAKYKTLILGGGIGGIVASQVLKKALGKEMQVTVVDKEENHYFSSSYPFLLIGKRKPEEVTRKLARLEKKGIEFIHTEVTALNPAQKLVTTDQGTMSCDYLVIALGAEYNPETVPGFSRNAYNIYDFKELLKAREALFNMRSGHVVLFISSTPYKCPPAPYEMVFLLDQFFRQKGLRSRIELTLVTPDLSPEPLAGPLVGRSVRNMLAKKGINLLTEAKVIRLEPGTLVLDHGEIKGDLFLGIAPHRAPSVLRETGLVDEAGWVKVDPYQLTTGCPSVYAVGDATAIRLPVIGALAPKAGIFAHYQAEVTARNIALLARGKKPVYRYTGKGACIMNTGFGRARYSTVHYYRQPAPFITLLRPAKPAYWAKILFEKYWLNRWL